MAQIRANGVTLPQQSQSPKQFRAREVGWWGESWLSSGISPALGGKMKTTQYKPRFLAHNSTDMSKPYAYFNYQPCASCLYCARRVPVLTAAGVGTCWP